MTNKHNKPFTALCFAIMLFATDAVAQTSVFEKECKKGQRADNYEFWEFIANNASRTADQYAMDHNPQAAFIKANVDAVFQVAGKYAGQYLVKVVGRGPGGTSFAMLKPNFPFCGNPSKLDDARRDLFEVVVAKFNGRPF